MPTPSETPELPPLPPLPQSPETRPTHSPARNRTLGTPLPLAPFSRNSNVGLRVWSHTAILPSCCSTFYKLVSNSERTGDAHAAVGRSAEQPWGPLPGLDTHSSTNPVPPAPGAFCGCTHLPALTSTSLTPAHPVLCRRTG